MSSIVDVQLAFYETYIILNIKLLVLFIGGVMFLIRLIYASTTSDGFEHSSLQNILDVSRLNNTTNGITGMLCFHNKYFLQCLEGSRKAVNDAYKMILNDDRHHNVVILEYTQIDVREFSDWCLGCIPTSKFTDPLLLKFSKSTRFNPYEMSGSSAHKLLLAFKKAHTSF